MGVWTAGTLADHIGFKPYTYYTHAIEPPTHYIIVGTSGIAKNPRRHSTYLSAVTESQRLAKKFAPEEFAIYEAKESFKTNDQPVVSTKFRSV